MNATERRTLKEKIQREILLLKEEIPALEDACQPIAPDVAIGRLSRMEAIGDKSVKEAALRESRARLLRLEYALNRIDSPGFGLCRSCEEPIASKRLLYSPDATLCIQCAREEEA